MVFCINAVVADHFKVPVRDMYDQPFDKVNGRDAFCDCFMVLMALIMERHTIPVIGINPGSGDDRSSKISADVFNGDIRRAQFKGELIQKDFTKSQAQEVIIKMGIGPPGSKVASAAFRNQGMDVRIPFQIPSKGMEDADKTRSKMFGPVKLEEHTQDDIPDRMEQAVKE